MKPRDRPRHRDRVGPTAMGCRTGMRSMPGRASRSWFQACSLMSLTMLDAAGVTASDSLIDVGGGASCLAGALLARGFRDITVLDISMTGMRYAQDRLGEQAQQVQWLATDVLAWEPLRRFRVWHDRAVFHFLTSPPGQHRYVRVLDAATETDAVAVFGCFAPDGPERCSGLPVARYDIPAQASPGRPGPSRTLRRGASLHWSVCVATLTRIRLAASCSVFSFR